VSVPPRLRVTNLMTDTKKINTAQIGRQEASPIISSYHISPVNFAQFRSHAYNQPSHNSIMMPCNSRLSAYAAPTS
jgi:hypothetical protein